MANLNAIYYALTSNGTWGRALNRDEALLNAKLPTVLVDNKKQKRETRVIVYIAIIKHEATDKELENVMNCFNVEIDGSIHMYDEPTVFDQNMVKEYLIGWVKESFTIKHK